MCNAMEIFKDWLSTYKKRKKEEDKNYQFLDLNVIKVYEKLAELYNVSNPTRGSVKSKKSDIGFLEMYKKVK